MFSKTAIAYRFTTIACIGFALILPAQSFSATQRKRANKPPAQQPVQAAPAPVQPQPELTPAQKPAVAPQVTYNNGQLTIVAENCTIGDVMRAVHSQTGAVVDLPQNASERVASRVGPGAPRDVLASLLNGSNFNYVLLGSAGDPKAIQHIILTPKPMGAGSANAMADAQQNTGQQGMMNGQPMPAATDPSETENQAEEAEEPQEDQAEAPPEGQQPAAEATPQPGVKTPEQLLQELQRQQVLQQQQLQQGAGPNATPPADQPNQAPQNPPQD